VQWVQQSFRLQLNWTAVGVEVKRSEKTNQNVGNLHTLAALLTGSHQIAGDVTLHATAPADDADIFSFTWMHSWAKTPKFVYWNRFWKPVTETHRLQGVVVRRFKVDSRPGKEK
jgi:hypothetical protein